MTFTEIYFIMKELFTTDEFTFEFDEEKKEIEMVAEDEGAGLEVLYIK